MLDYVEFRVGDGWWRFDVCANGNFPLARAFDFWMAELAHDHLCLGVCFRALAIMLQIPGADDYAWVGAEEKATALLQTCDQDTQLNILAHTLKRLGVGHLMKQVPAPDHVPRRLPKTWRKLIDERVEVKDGLLSLVADCLDVLVVRPGLADIDKPDARSWWRRWWARVS